MNTDDVCRLVSCIRELADTLDDWERYKGIPLEQFRSDRDSRNMVLHAMLVSIQSSVDIATEIIAIKWFRRPQSYRDTFGILAEEGILARDLARLLNRYGYRIDHQTRIPQRLSADISGKTHDPTIPRHKPLRVGTLHEILKDAAKHQKISREQIIMDLFG